MTPFKFIGSDRLTPMKASDFESEPMKGDRRLRRHDGALNWGAMVRGAAAAARRRVAIRVIACTGMV